MYTSIYKQSTYKNWYTSILVLSPVFSDTFFLSEKSHGMYPFLQNLPFVHFLSFWFNFLVQVE